jgi:ACS family tartrate transporter-like MFS transporter
VTVSFSTIALLGITLWLPQIIGGFGALSNVESGLLSALPFLCAGVAMVVNARHVDKTNELRFHVLIPAIVGAIGLICTAKSTSPTAGMVAICIATSGVLSANILFWNLPNLFLTGAAAAAGIAFMNSIGNLGGFVGPFLIGWAKDEFGSFASGMYILSVMIVLYGLSVFGFISFHKKYRGKPLRMPSSEVGRN